MKRLDMAEVCVVYAGEGWRHRLPPCSREMMAHLERNERLVSWLQPLKGTVYDQVPAIRVNNEFYTISLRMMKAIWRHVRLKKGFENVERAPYGGLKLRIPVALLAEKLRTQSRFNVSHCEAVRAIILVIGSFRVCCFIASLIFTLPLPGHAHGEPAPLPVRQGAQGVAVGLVQDRLHHPAALPAHAGDAHARQDVLPR